MPTINIYQVQNKIKCWNISTDIMFLIIKAKIYATLKVLEVNSLCFIHFIIDQTVH